MSSIKETSLHNNNNSCDKRFHNNYSIIYNYIEVRQ